MRTACVIIKSCLLLLAAIISISTYSQNVFSNSAIITFADINPSPEPANPYPSAISVSGQSGLISRAKITLHHFTHDFPDAVDIMVQSPSGVTVVILSDVGAAQDISGIDITIDDSASASLPDNSQIFAGTYKPTNIGTDDVWPANTPVPSGTRLADFNGYDPNGTWKLFASNDVSGGMGSISGGWSITLYTQSSALLETVFKEFRGNYDQHTGAVDLQWTFDRNVEYDSVGLEHSRDNITWNKITVLMRGEGRGSSYTHGRYMHSDASSSTNYYRLIVYRLRKTVTDKTIFVKIPHEFSRCQIFPNPARKIVYIPIDKRFSGKVELELLTMSGTILKTEAFNANHQHELQFNIDVKPGKYILSIKYDKQKIIQHFVVTS